VPFEGRKTYRKQKERFPFLPIRSAQPTHGDHLHHCGSVDATLFEESFSRIADAAALLFAMKKRFDKKTR
jgi:hypothetical protein